MITYTYYHYNPTIIYLTPNNLNNLVWYVWQDADYAVIL